MKLGYREIEAFRAVMTSGSLSAAAQVLNTSQPNISRLIAVLERAVQYPLFVRRSRGVVPTSEAHMLLAEVDRSFFGLKEISRAAQEIREYNGTQITLGSIPAFLFEIVPEAIRAWRQANGDISISIQPRGSQRSLHWIRTRGLDLGIISPIFELDDVNVIARWQLPYVVVTAPRVAMPVPIGTPLDLDTINDLPIIVPGLSFILSLCGDNDLAASLRKKTRIDGNISPTAAYLAMSELGLAIVDPITGGYFRRQFGANVRPLKHAPMFGVALVSPPPPARSRASTLLGELLKETINAAAKQMGL